LFCALSRGLVYISNANPACSCVYICKFQFRPIHPPSRRLSHLKLPVCLWNDDWIGQPHWVMNLFDEADVQQLLDLLSDEVLPLNRLSLRLLTHQFGVRVDLQMVLDHLPGDPRHLRRLPCEHVGICLEQGDEREFLFSLQITRNASGLGGICVEPDGLDGVIVCSGWSHLWHLGRRLGTGGRGVPPSVVRASSF
jgi:hypothetical protein